MATLVRHTLCATLSGLSKIYRACGFTAPCGWAVFSGDLEHASDYLEGSSCWRHASRLCSNVPARVVGTDGARWASRASASSQRRAGGCSESRREILAAVGRSKHLEARNAQVAPCTRS